ncbi:MAG TPA: hypothetical protein VKS82_09465 [Streptosporangiaceae bacterium]|nr:hypothetical protein [Streptosporangiaceae bacterium]
MTTSTIAKPAASGVLRALEATWQHIQSRHPQVPPVIIIMASGTGGKHTKWGHYAPQRWHASGENHAEIMISGEGLRRGARDVLGTLLHEAAHALAAARDIKDTSRQGRYHNKHFKALAEELGITVTHDQAIGWSVTSVPDGTAKTYARQITALDKAMTIWRHDEINGTGTGKRNTNLIAAACPCERSIRIAATVLADAPITCGACGSDFAPKDSL